MDNIDEIRKEIKSKRKNNIKIVKKFNYKKNITKFLITIILTLVVLINIKGNNKFKDKFYNLVYENNFSFSTINSLYQKYFGNPIPFLDIVNTKTEQVFNEKLEYNKVEKYLDGANLTVSDNYLVPILESGLVVFVGERDGYNNTVIIQQIDGVDVWYGNIDNVSVGLYDYVEKGTLLGEVNSNNLYLVFKKDGNVLDYETKI